MSKVIIEAGRNGLRLSYESFILAKFATKMVTITEIAYQNDIYMVWLLLGELLTQQQEE